MVLLDGDLDADSMNFSVFLFVLFFMLVELFVNLGWLLERLSMLLAS